MASRKRKRSLRAVFGTNLKIERVRQGLTQESVGAQIGTDQAYVSLIERGKIAISLDTYERIVQALGVKAADLLDEELARRTPRS